MQIVWFKHSFVLSNKRRKQQQQNKQNKTNKQNRRCANVIYWNVTQEELKTENERKQTPPGSNQYTLTEKPSFAAKQNAFL